VRKCSNLQGRKTENNKRNERCTKSEHELIEKSRNIVRFEWKWWNEIMEKNATGECLKCSKQGMKCKYVVERKKEEERKYVMRSSFERK
jgi:hypothetical protein